MGYVYVGESARGRLIRYGIGFSQIGDGYNLEVRYWDSPVMGDVGDFVCRQVTALIRHTGGYAVQVIPVLDGLELPAQSFSGGAPAGGKTEDVAVCAARVFRRARSVGAIVKTTSLLGETEIVDCQFSYVPLRPTP